LRTKII